ncbi:MAG: glycosyltransferase family 39 protein [Lachnospiraceae bacterium]|nr:glycosyltransferase family 39 protein [Lachnospiraceae bacterium]
MRRFYEGLIGLTEKFYWIFFALLCTLCAFLCFRCLGVGVIDSWDEARHGVSAYEMLQNGNFLVNTWCGEADYWNVKPPLSFLTVAAGFVLFGYNSVGLRFFPALFYLITTAVSGLFARRYGKLTSLLTMIFLCANYFPFKAHLVRSGDADSLYLLLFTLAMLAMLKIRENQRWIYACGLCFSLAFLTKSFHALMIAAIGGLFLLLSGELKRIPWKRMLLFLACALLPILVWAALRFRYDGFAFFRQMVETDLLGRTASEGIEGHGASFPYYLTSIFWNFDHIYGFLSVIVLLGLFCLWVRFLRKKDTPSGSQDLIGLLLWLLVPLFGFSLVSTKLMWYVYPCIVPLCMLAAIFLAHFFTSVKAPGGLLLAAALLFGAGSVFFVWENYTDNVRGARSNDLQTFVIEQFDRDSALAGSTVYLDAYDPFLYANTTEWEQNMRLLALLEGDLDCADGGADAFFASEDDALLILSVPFLADYPELENYEVLADNGQYLLIQKISLQH